MRGSRAGAVQALGAGVEAEMARRRQAQVDPPAQTSTPAAKPRNAPRGIRNPRRSAFAYAAEHRGVIS